MTEDPTVAVYYWEQQPNFGDALNVPLLEHFSRFIVEWAPPQLAQLVSIGSVLHSLPAAWGGVVAGAGMISASDERDLTNTQVYGLRGPLTVAQVKLPKRADYVLADPALLASELVTVERGKIPIGVVPHWTDRDLYLREWTRAMREGYVAPVLIDPTAPPLVVLEQIGSCEVIITSSLHGAIVAESFSIPHRLEQTPAMKRGDPYESDFKWRDHFAAMGVELEWGVKTTVPDETVWTKQKELFDMLREIGNVF